MLKMKMVIKAKTIQAIIQRLQRLRKKQGRKQYLKMPVRRQNK
jgi:hypothetical protein